MEVGPHLRPQPQCLVVPSTIHGVQKFIKKSGGGGGRAELRATPLQSTHCVLSTSQESRGEAEPGGCYPGFDTIRENCFVPNACSGVHCPWAGGDCPGQRLTAPSCVSLMLSNWML